MDVVQSSSRLREIFDSAVELPADQRGVFVAKACGDDAKLNLAVMKLLAAHERAGEFLADPTITSGQLEPAGQLQPGMRIARYTLIHLIGQGGCGIVYLAEQDPPLKRRVALKVIRPGLDSNQFIARFELERQLLVMMDHPNIARILDAGSTEDGRPYFVMELVDGRPVTDFCREFELDLPERLALFVTICDAVQHANARGIIHRDLKPQNVLVAMRDGNPIPKVIDFGISHALGGAMESAALVAPTEQYFLGTPQYMSPEQMSASDEIDARTDVYSLGALLYELIAGAPPFDPSRLGLLTYEHLRKVLTEQIPTKPSEHQQSFLANLQPGAARRCGQEIDRIVMKALSKDRAARHPTVEALATEVSRCIDDLKVSPPSPVDRPGRSARGLVAIVVILIALVAALTLRFKPRSETVTSANQRIARATSREYQAPLSPGLVAQLYRGWQFETFVGRRIDSDIHFEWGPRMSPDSRIAPPRYSIRWDGTIVIPPGGIYGMAVRADDGARLFIDEQLLLGFEHPGTKVSHTLVSAGRHAIRLEYWNRMTHGDVSLYWFLKDAPDAQQLVPPSALGHLADDHADNRH